jgi:hypothetical protein
MATQPTVAPLPNHPELDAAPLGAARLCSRVRSGWSGGRVGGIEEPPDRALAVLAHDLIPGAHVRRGRVLADPPRQPCAQSPASIDEVALLGRGQSGASRGGCTAARPASSPTGGPPGTLPLANFRTGFFLWASFGMVLVGDDGKVERGGELYAIVPGVREVAGEGVSDEVAEQVSTRP